MSAIKKGTIVAAMLAGFTALTVQGATASEEQKTFKPMHAVSVHVGSKHAIGYFEPVSGICQLTLVVGEEPTGAGVVEIMPTRFRAAVKAGQRVSFDTGEGKELAFYCGPAATAMSVETMQQTAYTPVAR
ncbi:conserved exported protein of unknown function [Hyphomicrobium sp. 1Nfss2.1]|uniref:hypothetical protein n=1 Tax=Hyphomicrobium sp. 1Nfss2.1 TaxID=3413936 RepID=UPI003C7E2DF6